MGWEGEQGKQGTEGVGFQEAFTLEALMSEAE